ncbi:MAG: hypothetical protein QMD46_12305 [Methanomicrobiales archaeon]|nr:hypothetical protein [Methanomicrobiales archaeon]
MVVISELIARYAAQGYQQVVDAENRVRKAISETARTAAKDEGTTKRWMERHKSALQSIGLAAAGAMAAIIALSPDLRAALGETYLWFSMLAMEIGETWAPAFDWLAEKAEALYEWFDSLPEPVQDVIAWGALLVLGLLAIAGAAATAAWILPILSGGFGLLGGSFLVAKFGALAALLGMSTLALGLSILAGLVLGGIVVWGLWKLGIIQAVEDAGAAFGRWLHNALTILGNFKDNVVQWLQLVAATASVWGAQFALNWVENVVKNVPLLGEKLGGLLDPIRQQLETARATMEAGWADWNARGGFAEGLTVGVQTGPDLIGGADTALFGLVDALTGTSDAIDDEQARMQELLQTLGPDTSKTAEQFAASMTSMQSNISTTARTTEIETAKVHTAIASTFTDLVNRSPVWGSDLMGKFIDGVRSRMPQLQAELSAIRAMIEAALSFDIAENDRLAEQWGRDMVTHFNRGARAIPVAAPAPAGGGGATVHVTVERGAVQISGSDARGMDEQKLARYVSDAIGKALRGRS